MVKKQIIIVMCVAVLAFFISGCGSKDPAQERAVEEARRVQMIQSEADEVYRSIQYTKDPRTGLCFAYRWGARVFDGPSLALASVPCEAIPPDLLITAR